MKKSILFVLFLVFSIFLFNKFHIIGYSTLKIGDIEEIGGKSVTIQQISTDSVVVSVNGIINIVHLNDYKNINGIRISVSEIFFVDEREGRKVELSLESLYTCGDGICEGDETKENCCKDCECDLGYICEKDKCIIESKSSNYDECKDKDDCDDNNELTIDKCKGIPKKCVHKEYYQCKNNADCNDNNECTKDECRTYECFNTKISDCKSEIKTEQPLKENQIVPKEGDGEKQKSFLSRLFSKLFWWLK